MIKIKTESIKQKGKIIKKTNDSDGRIFEKID